MKKVVVQFGQSLSDIAVQELGSLEALVGLAELNGRSITETLQPGTTLLIEEAAAIRPELVAEFQRVGLKVNNSVSVSVPEISFKFEATSFSVTVESGITWAVRNGQSLADIAVQKAGSFEGLVELARLNGLSITEQLTTGQELKLIAAIRPELANEFQRLNLVINNSRTMAPAPVTAKKGFDYTFDFELS